MFVSKHPHSLHKTKASYAIHHMMHQMSSDVLKSEVISKVFFVPLKLVIPVETEENLSLKVLRQDGLSHPSLSVSVCRESQASMSVMASSSENKVSRCCTPSMSLIQYLRIP